MAVGDGANSCFISYARDDQVWAEWAAWQLKDAGYEVWLDTWSLAPGADWQDTILTWVRGSGHMLVLARQTTMSAASSRGSTSRRGRSLWGGAVGGLGVRERSRERCR
ncbi:toll/interleukin-1 receptor domain-containing protein [Streptomyces sp. ISL-14]|nr:toll/interleukin-1 receptor domain-containing protein [Streptomyces sp. ISL-14]